MSTYTDILIDAADALLEGAAADGGATVDIHTGAPVDLTHGYVVSMDGYGWELDPLDVSSLSLGDVVQQYVNRAPEWIGSLTTANPVYVGAWIDTDTNVLHLDLSAVFTGLEFALTVAREQNQVAIWDVENGCEIRVADADVDYSHDDDELHPDEPWCNHVNQGSKTVCECGTPIAFATATLGYVTLDKVGV